MTSYTEKELFESVPVPRAVAALAVPTIISQIVAIIYNLADTFFIGQMGNPYMVAAVTLVYPWFNMLTAIGNLFGIGGSSVIARMLGAGRDCEVKFVSAFSVYGGTVFTLAFSLGTWFFREPLLEFLGASSENIRYSENYMFWVVVLGGIPTMLSMTMSHLIRSEGHAKAAGAGMMCGGILNIILDPLLIFAAGMGFTGAAVATALSNLASLVFLTGAYVKMRKHLALSLNPVYMGFRYMKPVLSVGAASAVTVSLASFSNIVIVKLAAAYGDIPVAAYGIVKKIDQFPLGICQGLYQGFMPLVGYNYASGDYRRMRAVSVFSWKTALIIGGTFAVCFLVTAPEIIQAFIRDAETERLGADFLRIACLAVPFTAVNALVIYTLQAMGKGALSGVLSVCRQGLLNIPVLIIMNMAVGLYGMIWTQLIIELIMIPATLGMYTVTWKKITGGNNKNESDPCKRKSS